LWDDMYDFIKPSSILASCATLIEVILLLESDLLHDANPMAKIASNMIYVFFTVIKEVKLFLF